MTEAAEAKNWTDDDLPIGECVVEYVGSGLVVRRADRWIHATAELVSQIATGGTYHANGVKSFIIGPDVEYAVRRIVKPYRDGVYLCERVR